MFEGFTLLGLLATTGFGKPVSVHANHKEHVMSDNHDTKDKPRIVLARGAFAESSCWNGVVAELLARGYPVIAAANPLGSVRCDAEYVASLLKSIDGSVVLVGRSYGGTVITNAAKRNNSVKALVHVAAFAPEAGEIAAELSAHFPGSTLGDARAPPLALPSRGSDLYIQQDKFGAQFAADVPDETDGRHPTPDHCGRAQRSLQRTSLENDPVLVHLRRSRQEYSSGGALLYGRACRLEGNGCGQGGVARGDDFASAGGRQADQKGGEGSGVAAAQCVAARIKIGERFNDPNT